jgi:hypothetical protein
MAMAININSHIQKKIYAATCHKKNVNNLLGRLLLYIYYIYYCNGIILDYPEKQIFYGQAVDEFCKESYKKQIFLPNIFLIEIENTKKNRKNVYTKKKKVITKVYFSYFQDSLSATEILKRPEKSI